ncbi:MAG TPA: DNA-processing protein DprA [Acidimicrobiales bacterium]|nr:DNA-processing protein DprA [Acidimicrobiales bacterium]
MTTAAHVGCAIALASLPGMGPGRLRALLEAHPPTEAWRRVRHGHEGACRQRAADHLDPDGLAKAHAEAQVTVHVLDGPDYPPRLADDPEAPAVLFATGDLALVRSPLVGIVGTRRCTRAGRDVARELARAVAAAGVGVVSGLAVGIDGAAHEGALEVEGARPVGVVASGLDVVYPRRHERLWQRVAQAGVLLSEWPLGTRPDAWRFPARNRIIAALSDVLVVVESHAAGGSMHTVEAADRRGRTVLAVPGPVRSPASKGTNRLLFDGHGPALDADDVLSALGLATAGAGPPAPPRPVPTGVEATVLAAVDWEPTAVETILVRTGLTPMSVALALRRLEHAAWVRDDAGWWERIERSS